MIKKIWVLLAAACLSVAFFGQARVLLPKTVNCANINDNIGLINQLEDSGSFRELIELPQPVEFDFRSDVPFSEYLVFARDKVLLENPKGQLPCPIQSKTSKLLYPKINLDLQLVVFLGFLFSELSFVSADRSYGCFY